jgi:hypothetical protein
MVTELTSGHDLNGFSYDFDVWNGMGWDDYFLVPSAPGAIHQFLTPGLYRVKAAVQDGAGLTGQSRFYYVNAVPEPESVALIIVTQVAAASSYRQRLAALLRTGPRPRPRCAVGDYLLSKRSPSSVKST